MTLLIFPAGVTAICLDRHNSATDSSPIPSLPDIERVGGEVRKIGVPVLSDLKARRHPDLFMIVM
jgi:hypothetical protein